MASIDEQLIDPSTYANEGFYDLFAKMREEHPIHRTKGKDGVEFWSLFRHADVRRVLNETEVFSSEVEGVIPIFDEALKEVSADAFGRGQSIIATDPNRHGQLRSVVSKPFMPNALKASTDHVAGVIRKIFDQLPANGEIDLVDDLAAKIPMAVVADILGVPEGDSAQLLKWGKMALTATDPEYSEGDSAAVAAAGFDGLRDYIRSLAMPMRGCPHAGILGDLVNDDIDGEKLTESEVVHNGVLMVLAGFETTRNSFSGGLLALLQHPEQMEKLRSDPRKIRLAIEEIVRWTNPVISLMRVAKADTEIGGHTIKAGDRVVTWVASANRDDSVFDHPDRFDITRTPNRHIAFGFGPHACLGGPLARIELQLALEELMERYEGFEMLGEPERVHSSFVGGLKRFPIRLTARKFEQKRAV